MKAVTLRPIGKAFAQLLVGCLFLSVSSIASAMTITKAVDINVVSVCSSTAGCASDGPVGDKFFQTEVNKIWAQAGIQVNFVSQSYLTNDNYYNINDRSASSSFYNLDRLYGGASDSTIYMYLVHSINGGTAWGEGWVDGSGFVIAMDQVVSANRLDTVAHELGHNLGLLPTSDGGVGWHSTDPYDLMASGSIRYSPANIGEISTDGLTGKDQLPLDQVLIARSSRFLYDLAAEIDEPQSVALLLVGLVGVGGMQRRQKQAQADKAAII